MERVKVRVRSPWRAEIIVIMAEVMLGASEELVLNL